MPQSPPNTWIVMPALNEAAQLSILLRDIQKAGFSNILVVDDGSNDDTRRTAIKSGAIAIKHPLNRGKGAATKTGITAARQLGADIIVTMDADGQHAPQDITRIIEPIQSGQYEVVLGTRTLNRQKMPLHKKIANQVANSITWLLFGLWVNDSQSGFRAFSRHAADLIDTRGDKYEYESEVIREIKLHQLPYQEIPIQVRYTEYSTSKKNRQTLLNGVKTVTRMIWNQLT